MLLFETRGSPRDDHSDDYVGKDFMNIMQTEDKPSAQRQGKK